MGPSVIDWMQVAAAVIQAISGVVQAGSAVLALVVTCVLAALTWQYVRLTKDLSLASQNAAMQSEIAAKAAMRSADAAEAAATSAEESVQVSRQVLVEMQLERRDHATPKLTGHLSHANVPGRFIETMHPSIRNVGLVPAYAVQMTVAVDGIPFVARGQGFANALSSLAPGFSSDDVQDENVKPRFNLATPPETFDTATSRFEMTIVYRDLNRTRYEYRQSFAIAVSGMLTATGAPTINVTRDEAMPDAPGPK